MRRCTFSVTLAALALTLPALSGAAVIGGSNPPLYSYPEFRATLPTKPYSVKPDR